MKLPGGTWGRFAGPSFFGARAAATALLALAPSIGLAWEPYLTLDSFAHAQPQPIHSYAGDWDEPLQAGTDAITHNLAETGVRDERWSLAYVQRYDYEIKASRGAVELYHRARNKQPFSAGEHFDLDLAAWHVRLQGLRGAWRFDLGAYGDLEAGLSIYEAWALVDGRLRGVARAIAERDYDFDVQVEYDYSEDLLFDREATGPGGTAWSLDARWRLTFAARGRLDLTVRDALGRVHWQDAPYTRARATSDTKEFDEDGYVRYNPTLSGFEGYRDHDQRLHPRALLAADWEAWPAQRLGVQLRLTEVRHYASVHWTWDLPHDLQLKTEALIDPLALGLALSWRGFTFGWTADALEPHEANLLQLALRAGWTF